jgi:hypothetical protein
LINHVEKLDNVRRSPLSLRLEINNSFEANYDFKFSQSAHDDHAKLVVAREDPPLP